MIMLYLVGFAVSVYLVSGMFYSDIHATCKDDPIEWQKQKRRTAGIGIAIAVAFSICWPAGLPLAWLISGFAEDGVWK